MTPTKTKTRIYAVKAESGAVVDLIRATSQSQAFAHKARETWRVDVASQDELVNAAGAGIKVQSAKPEPRAEGSQS